MSEESVEVTEEVSEPVESGIDINAASDQIAENLFGTKPGDDPVEPDDEYVEIEASDETEEKEAVGTDESDTTEDAVQTKAAPNSWKKEMHEAFSSLDPEVQDYIELREEQMKNGVQVKEEDANLGMRMRDAMAPFAKLLSMSNVDEVEAAKRLMTTHNTLLSAPLEQKKQYFDQLARTYGIQQETEGEADDQTVQMRNQINHLNNKLQALENVSKQDREKEVSQTVAEFAKEHSHFEDLSDEIARLIRGGFELDEAYKAAYRASDYFEKDLEDDRKKKSEEAIKAKKKEAEKAKKAKSVNVRTRDTGKAPTGPAGTMKDTMNDVFRQIQNRT